MTNLYFSTRACAHFKIEPFQTTVEVSLWHWHAHVFILDGKEHMIFVEDRSHYAVVVFAINENVEDCVDAFVRKLERQIASMNLEDNQLLLSSSLFSQVNVYPMPYKGKPMTMITHLIGRLKNVFEESKNPTAVKLFAETGLNEIPWKVNNYDTASEVLRVILSA